MENLPGPGGIDWPTEKTWEHKITVCPLIANLLTLEGLPVAVNPERVYSALTQEDHAPRASGFGSYKCQPRFVLLLQRSLNGESPSIQVNVPHCN
jgi:hypothetical protein